MPNKELSLKVSYTVDELTDILSEDAEKRYPGFEVTHVNFKVNGHNDPGDWRAEFPLDYRLDEVAITMKPKTS